MGKWKKRGARKAARRWRVKALITKHGGRCAFCRCFVTLAHNTRHQATVDHVIPLSRGGDDLMSNLQLLCRECNQNKGSTIIGEDGEVEKVSA